MAKNNIITATKEVVKELKGDVPEGETPPAHNGVIHASLGREEVQGSSHVIQAPLSPEATEGEEKKKNSKPGLDVFTGALSKLAIDNQSYPTAWSS